MLNITARFFAALIALTLSGVASAVPMADVSLSSFIQIGSISNNASSGANISTLVYDLGTPGDGIATWDLQGGGRTAGGVASNFLSNPNFAQTITFSGLSIAPGALFNFSSLDIDLIQILSPLSVTGGTLDTTGSSLVNASFSVFWDNGTSGTTALIQQAWATTQTLTVTAEGEGQTRGTVPIPSSISLLLLGLAGIGMTRKKKTA
ncbi:PEP-CTERM sorting domain-containing protein [Aestuariirhabdus sp. LZHN29]|uniref:PEP-CTERM sorting domain-containing protein n=1 Tax=Aestuariirhabdus sp. LZHN29 TaxID=3417462 RepID=UPI003CF6153B